MAEEMRYRGRPKTGTPIHVRVNEDVLAAIDAKAVETGRPRAVLIREALELYVAAL